MSAAAAAGAGVAALLGGLSERVFSGPGARSCGAGWCSGAWRGASAGAQAPACASRRGCWREAACWPRQLLQCCCILRGGTNIPLQLPTRPPTPLRPNPAPPRPAPPRPARRQLLPERDAPAGGGRRGLLPGRAAAQRLWAGRAAQRRQARVHAADRQHRPHIALLPAESQREGGRARGAARGGRQRCAGGASRRQPLLRLLLRCAAAGPGPHSGQRALTGRGEAGEIRGCRPWGPRPSGPARGAYARAARPAEARALCSPVHAAHAVLRRSLWPATSCTM